MTAIGPLLVITAIGVVGLLLIAHGWAQRVPSLQRVIGELERPSPVGEHAGRSGRLTERLVRIARSDPRILPSATDLRLVDRSVERHVGLLVIASLVAGIAPVVLLALLQLSGFVGLGWFVPLIGGLVGAAVGPVLIHVSATERAAAVRTDLRYQVSAYLDVVTMLLAGNTGYEGALEGAAHAGDGRLFTELRRRMRESGARGASLTDALERTGRALGLDELEQIAATAALSAAEGAPVARTLSAKCATLRAALSTEQEAEARLRTSRLTTPIVGMALIFMSLVIYPALTFS